jgi:hypothetical protein
VSKGASLLCYLLALSPMYVLDVRDVKVMGVVADRAHQRMTFDQRSFPIVTAAKEVIHAYAHAALPLSARTRCHVNVLLYTRDKPPL